MGVDVSSRAHKLRSQILEYQVYLRKTKESPGKYILWRESSIVCVQNEENGGKWRVCFCFELCWAWLQNYWVFWTS
jgi:hypothetical protein